jgi:hypothetical protein
MPHEKVVRAKALRESLRQQLLDNDEFYLYERMPPGESEKAWRSSQ